MSKTHWSSQLGFILAAAGSAIGLANVWRFPYIVGRYGGAAFIVVYLIFLLLIGLPVFAAEVLIGRKTHKAPAEAFGELGGCCFWQGAGLLTIFTGFVVSCFYSVVAGWVLGYFLQSLTGELTLLHTTKLASHHFEGVLSSPWWPLFCHALFMTMSSAILYLGVRGGIERANRWMLPVLFLSLLALMVRSLFLPGAIEGIRFLFTPDWSVLTPAALTTALGHAFFTLSLGQGTMVTYGSYLKDEENLLTVILPAILMDTLVSLFAAVAIFSIVFAGGLQPDSGPGLLFQTLPTVFADLPGSLWMTPLFFFLVLLAALTSQISAMEPVIAFSVDRFHMRRHRAVIACGLAVFLGGVPCALSTSLLTHWTFWGKNILDLMSGVASDFLIPVGGFAAVVLVGWRWGVDRALTGPWYGQGNVFSHSWVKGYLRFCLRWSAPALMIVILLSALYG